MNGESHSAHWLVVYLVSGIIGKWDRPSTPIPIQTILLTLNSNLHLLKKETTRDMSIEVHLITISIIAFCFFFVLSKIKHCLLFPAFCKFNWQYCLRTEKKLQLNAKLLSLRHKNGMREGKIVLTRCICTYCSKQHRYKTWTLKLLLEMKMNVSRREFRKKMSS